MRINTFVILLLLNCILFLYCDSSNPNDQSDTPQVCGVAVLIQSANNTFSMGDSIEAKPNHDVTFTYDFYMDSVEVTQKDFHSVMSEYYTNYYRPLWTNIGTGDNFPTYNIAWYEATLYCNARSKRDGFDTVYSYDSIVEIIGRYCTLTNFKVNLGKTGYRLPSEAEWEYACRGGTTTKYYWGDSVNGDYVWYEDNSNSKAHEVAGKLKNGFGLYDMNGNLSEFCNDWFDSDYYSKSPSVNPFGPYEAMYKVLRGGSWVSPPVINTSAKRSWCFLSNDQVFNDYKGFRCVIEKK